MDEVLVLLVLAVIAVPVSIIVLFLQTASLRNRVALLERALAQAGRDALAAVAAPPMAKPPAPVPAPIVAAPVTAAPVAASVAAAPSPWDAAAKRAAPAQAATWQAAPVPAGPTVLDIWLTRAQAWLRENWVFAVAGVSLALAGIFLAQYGAERGLLPPALRVASAGVFGLALIAAGEGLRRRWGDNPTSATAFLPQIFSGAGLVSVFAALLAARQLYGLIGPEITFAGLALTAAGAIVLGWVNGPALVALGLAGAVLAPFVVGGNSDSADWLFAYFALIGAVGLAVDTWRRWGWVSVLSLALAAGAGGLLWLADSGLHAGFLLELAALALLAVMVPARGVLPDHKGAGLIALTQGARPEFPALLAMGAVAVASAVAALLPVADGVAVLPYAILAGLALYLTLACDDAPALQDVALLPAAGFVVRLATDHDAAALFARLRAPEVPPPLTVSLLLATLAVMALALAWRSTKGGAAALVMAGAAAAGLPVAGLVLDRVWHPAAVLGGYEWALHLLALAGLATWLAQHFGRVLADPRRAAYFVLAAFALIALALFSVTTKAALNLSLAALVVAAAALDRRYRLPEMAWAVQAGVLVLGWRLVADPGIAWALEAPALPVALAHIGPLAGIAAALWLLRDMGRDFARSFLESGGIGALAISADVVLVRQFTPLELGNQIWLSVALAYPWLVSGLVQAYRARLPSPLRPVRYGLAMLGGLFAALAQAFALFMNPLSAWGDRVAGPMLLDTLLITYALPGLTLILGRRWLGHLPRGVQKALMVTGTGLLAIYTALEIRRFWQGDDLSGAGTSQPELYSYTLALLVAGAAVLWQALRRGDDMLRKMAMGLIGLTAAKVFLIDAAGLTGLMRVFSFLALGLALAGLAALNRWAVARTKG